jgi:fatty-acyl-CoA synthase
MFSACWTLPDHVDQAAQRWPDTEALVWPDERLTFAEFAARTRGFAHALLQGGVAPGDKVGILMRNTPGMLVAIYGTTRIGAIPVPINGRYKEREIVYVSEHAEIKLLVTEELSADGDDDALRVLEERIAVRDTAMLMYTSGTTSHPKGCLISHESLVRTGRIFGEQRFPMQRGDRMWNPLPIFHLASILPFNGCLATGATYVGLEHFEPGAALRMLEQCTVAFAAFDLIWAAVLDHPAFASTDLSALRLVNVNGVPERLRRFAERTPWLTLISPYGGTEGGGVLALSHLDDPLEYRVGSAGRPFAGMEVRIVDAEGSELPPGERGEITYRGPALFDGYFKDPEQTAARIDADGFFHSGDLGVVDQDGRLRFIGRLKDMLKVGGENVAAAEIEGFLAEHPAIAEVQVVAAPDERYQEVACAFVVLRPGTALTLDELIGHCHGQIASFKIPRYLRIVDEWPMSGTKIQKFKLRERIAAELAETGVRAAPKLSPPRP